MDTRNISTHCGHAHLHADGQNTNGTHLIDSTYGVLATPQLQRPDYMVVTAIDAHGVTFTGKLYPKSAKIITMTEAQFNALVADAKEEAS